MKKDKHLPTTAKIFLNEYDVPCVECVKCRNYMPNAKPGKYVCCQCGYEFEAVK